MWVFLLHEGNKEVTQVWFTGQVWWPSQCQNVGYGTVIIAYDVIQDALEMILCHKLDTSHKVWDLANNLPMQSWPPYGAEGGQVASQLNSVLPLHRSAFSCHAWKTSWRRPAGRLLPRAYHALELHVTVFLDSHINSITAQHVHMSQFTAETAIFLALWQCNTWHRTRVCVCVCLGSCSHAFFVCGGEGPVTFFHLTMVKLVQ